MTRVGKKNFTCENTNWLDVQKIFMEFMYRREHGLGILVHSI